MGLFWPGSPIQALSIGLWPFLALHLLTPPAFLRSSALTFAQYPNSFLASSTWSRSGWLYPNLPIDLVSFQPQDGSPLSHTFAY